MFIWHPAPVAKWTGLFWALFEKVGCIFLHCFAMFNPDVRNLTLKSTPVRCVKFVVWSLPRLSFGLTELMIPRCARHGSGKGSEMVHRRSKLSKSYVFQILPTTIGSRNRLPSYDSLQDVKGPLHSKLSIKSFSVLAQISLKLTIDSIFAVAVTGWFPSHCGPHRYKSPSKSGTAVGTKQHAKHGDPGIKDMTRSIRQHFVSWRIALQFKMPTLGPKDMGETG